MKLELMLRRVLGSSNNFVGDATEHYFPIYKESFERKACVSQVQQSENFKDSYTELVEEPAETTFGIKLPLRQAINLNFQNAIKYVLDYGNEYSTSISNTQLPTNLSSGHHRFGLQMNSISRQKTKEAKDARYCKPITCQWKRCKEVFESDLSLIQHVHNIHLKEQQLHGYICHWRNCSRNERCFDARHKLVTHIRTHTKEKLFHCNICSKTFARREALKIHFRSHTGERPYQCTYLGCQKSFKNSSDRHKHVKTHKERQPYKCRFPGCQKQYTDPSTLRKHKKCHVVIPPKEVTSSDVSGRNKTQAVDFLYIM